MNKILPLLAFSALLLVPLVAQDAFAMTIIFEEDPPTANDIVCGPGACGDDFVLTSSSTITDVHFWIVDTTGLGDNVYHYQIHADDGAGLPLEPPIQAGIGVVNMPEPVVSTIQKCTSVIVLELVRTKSSPHAPGPQTMSLAVGGSSSKIIVIANAS